VSATLSVITLTKNEELNIAECLESVAWADEIIIIDSGSSDRTIELARQYTSNVTVLPWLGYGAARNKGLARSRSDWILWLDADERVTEDLSREIRTIVERDDQSVAGYEIARRAYFCGKWIRHGGWYPSRVVRLFRRDRARFSEHRVHERVLVEGRLGRTRFDLMHYTDRDLEHYFTKFNLYTSLAAHDMLEAGRGFSVLNLVVRPLFQFVKMYVLRLGFLDGIHGFVLCVASSAYVFTKYAKLWELRKTEKQ
jgi:glycosyltransferase involved in cell wall biosynthesis